MEKSKFDNSIYGNIQKLAQISNVEGDVYIVDIAESLLKNTIQEMIHKHLTTYSVTKIENNLLENFKKSESEIHEIRTILDKVITEIKILSSRTPGLSIKGDSIEIEKAKKKVPFGGTKFAHTANSQIELLKLAVDNRRLELGLPTQRDVVGINWASELNELERKVSSRRQD